MKNIYSSISIFILMLVSSYTFAQQSGNCPGCVPDANCTISPAFPTLCPPALPSDTVGNYYDEIMQFYMPANFDDPGTGFNVDLEWVEVIDIVNIPFGLTWTLDIYPNVTYYPTQNPPSTEHGCVRVCGTPILPFNDSIQVFVKVFVDAGITTQELVQSFKVGLTIYPSASGNASFTVSNPTSCAPLVTDVTTNFPSNGNPGFSYNWDFGNGTSSTSETLPTITYNTPGTYDIIGHTVIDTLPYRLNYFRVESTTCSDAFSETDFYFKLFENGQEVMNTQSTFGAVANTDAPVNIPFTPYDLQNTTYTIEVWDEDGGFKGGDDLCGTIAFNGHSSDTLVLSQGGSLTVKLNIDHQVIEFFDTTTVTVLENPEKPMISMTVDTICEGDTVTISTTSGDQYTWFLDSILISGLDTSTFTTSDSGTYWVVVTNSSGCSDQSDPYRLVSLYYPPTPTFSNNGNTLTTGLTGYHLQWYLNGNPIPGANQNSYTITESGAYSVIATNSFGCASTSIPVEFAYIPDGMEELGLENFELYPNPNDGRFNLSFDVQENSKITISVHDMLGKIVYREDLSNFFGNYNRSMDLSNNSKGVYTLSILNEERQLVKAKIVID